MGLDSSPTDEEILGVNRFWIECEVVEAVPDTLCRIGVGEVLQEVGGEEGRIFE